MAVPTASGSEAIHSASFEDVCNEGQVIITGEQHHIYTVLSVIVQCVGVHASANTIELYLVGYDSNGGTSAQSIHLAKWTGVANETFVFSDRFSFFGYEPSSNSQAARVAQAGSTAQQLQIYTPNTDCKIDCHVSFIDQNWS
tara:strand:- start:927 stop:1352 length:426 start_codon:yes stop_codon:yes gene_type:complete